MKKPELVAPAGNLEKLKVAFHFGADAVYAGLKEFSLRAKTKNFNEEEITEAVQYSHSIGKKIYIALNIYFTPDETETLSGYLKFLNKIKPDGIIISDLGAFYLAKEHAPLIPVHISTQANITNQYSSKLLTDLGASRIILARELTLDQIKKIADYTETELEAFVHGAMCIAYSGRCLLSAYMTHPNLGRRKDITSEEIRSANKGDCSHSCRWEYILKEKTRGEQEYQTYEDDTGTYLFSSKDICMIDYIGDLLNAGIKSFKIEGRMKSILYISSIIRAYRRAIDHYFNTDIEYNKETIDDELNVVSHREFCTGFFFNSPGDIANTTKGGLYKRQKRLAAMVSDVDKNNAVLKVYNTINIDDKLEYIAPEMKTYRISKVIFYDKDATEIKKINHSEYVEAKFWDENGELIKLNKFDIIRMNAEF